MKVMKRLIPVCVVCISVFTAHAWQPRDVQRGYRGFAEWSTDITSYKYDEASRATAWSTGISTSHGYQFSPRFFLGAGVGFQPSVNSSGADLVPLFIQARTDQTWGKFTPFGDLRVGYNMCDGGGLYLSPSVGYRFNWGRRLNLNVGVGMTLRGTTTEQYQINVIPLPDGTFAAEMLYQGKHHSVKPMFSLRVGIDF